MTEPSRSTAYAHLTPRQARAALAAWALGSVLCVAITLSPAASGVTPQGRPGAGDNALYWAIANRVSAGEGFHQALAQELLARNYPMASVFNWRMPLPMAMIGWLPYPWIARLMLGALGLGVIVLAVEMLVRQRRGSLQAALGALLLTGPVGVCVLDDLFVMPVVWAGAWMALSVCAMVWSGAAWRLRPGSRLLCFANWLCPIACFVRRWLGAIGGPKKWRSGPPAWRCGPCTSPITGSKSSG